MIDANNNSILIGHIFTHPWHRDEFPPLNSMDKLKNGMDRLLNDPSCKRMIYLNELGVRPVARGFNIGRLLVNHALENLSNNGGSGVPSTVQLVSVQGSARFWEALGFQLEQLNLDKSEYLKKNYGLDAVFMTKYLPIKPMAHSNHYNSTNTNNNQIVKKSLILSAY
ncbi:hypothetical protein PPL_03450 [Heterostelium album PN500]|uniref:N-acetyltransferase domain-containing protein n=1 Tax=Heterostelium pallidum (strain ATCC 26659 / Pp 5 / PN500) TaxID=670386 RepID=D3B4X4_HETP5|nr:hypothetical protein PPL_03450 [Heterostelium album PN500]EFA84372.1 hypothetical protein PPL_03450 [Heterostelium album PN500]|eukprot:XP_020436487.1 hypothetical protein PPL_03450 [Heterostelium album PN500]